MPGDASQSGLAIQQGAGELLRIWRLARATAKRELGAGLLDDVMGIFFQRAGKLLAENGKPENVWEGLAGVMRVSAAKGPQALTEEWAIAMEVLAAACEALQAEATVADWLARAVGSAEAACTSWTAALGVAQPGEATLPGGDPAAAAAPSLETRVATPMSPEPPPPKPSGLLLLLIYPPKPRKGAATIEVDTKPERPQENPK
jgi:hypothetical protein